MKLYCDAGVWKVDLEGLDYPDTKEGFSALMADLDGVLMRVSDPSKGRLMEVAAEWLNSKSFPAKWNESLRYTYAEDRFEYLVYEALKRACVRTTA